MKKVYIIVTALLLLTSSAKAAEKKEEAKPPIDITSDSLEASGGDIIFVGHVHAVYGEKTINSDRLQLLYETVNVGSGAEKKQEIKTIVATGNVKLVEANRTAWADKMVFERATNIATLTGGPPKVEEGDNTISGDVITVFSTEGRVEVKGNVKATVKSKTTSSTTPKEK